MIRKLVERASIDVVTRRAEISRRARYVDAVQAAGAVDPGASTLAISLCSIQELKIGTTLLPRLTACCRFGAPWESLLPPEVTRTADVSPLMVPVDRRKLLIALRSEWNGLALRRRRFDPVRWSWLPRCTRHPDNRVQIVRMGRLGVQ